MEPVHRHGPVAMPDGQELLLRGGKGHSLRQLPARCRSRCRLDTGAYLRAAGSARVVWWENELARLRLLPARAHARASKLARARVWACVWCVGVCVGLSVSACVGMRVWVVVEAWGGVIRGKSKKRGRNGG